MHAWWALKWSSHFFLDRRYTCFCCCLWFNKCLVTDSLWKAAGASWVPCAFFLFQHEDNELQHSERIWAQKWGHTALENLNNISNPILAGEMKTSRVGSGKICGGSFSSSLWVQGQGGHHKYQQNWIIILIFSSLLRYFERSHCFQRLDNTIYFCSQHFEVFSHKQYTIDKSEQWWPWLLWCLAAFILSLRFPHFSIIWETTDKSNRGEIEYGIKAKLNYYLEHQWATPSNFPMSQP
jgi:hypothetical protein